MKRISKVHLKVRPWIILFGCTGMLASLHEILLLHNSNTYIGMVLVLSILMLIFEVTLYAEKQVYAFSMLILGLIYMFFANYLEYLYKCGFGPLSFILLLICYGMLGQSLFIIFSKKIWPMYIKMTNDQQWKTIATLISIISLLVSIIGLVK